MLADADSLFEKRVVQLNSRPVDGGGDCIVYWMQRSQRAYGNLALKYAAGVANHLQKPLLVYFGLYDRYPMGSARAFRFMLEGLKETAAALGEHGVGFVFRREQPWVGVVSLAEQVRACAVVVDEDYLKTGRVWRSSAAERLRMRCVQVDADTIVPARNTPKEEWGAYTLRPKILKVLQDYLIDIPDTWPQRPFEAHVDSWRDITCEDPAALASSLDVEQKVAPVEWARGGHSKAVSRLNSFIDNKLPDYAQERNEIGVDCTSGLSPYLHFGQISPLEAALAVSGSDAPDESVDAFLEQLIVRRELAINFCLYNDKYDSLDGAPQWARETLERHRSDPRPEVYSLQELERAQTHDELWNAAQTELVSAGRIHGYMRMLWAKKLLEWSESPEDALARALFLNDKYALDGRDPNGYANIAWCIYGKHDRPFPSRPVFGRIRYMSTAAAKRKMRWQDYVSRVQKLNKNPLKSLHGADQNR